MARSEGTRGSSCQSNATRHARCWLSSPHRGAGRGAKHRPFSHACTRPFCQSPLSPFCLRVLRHVGGWDHNDDRKRQNRRCRPGAKAETRQEVVGAMEMKEARKGVRGQSAKASPRCDVCAGREQAVFGKDVPGRRARESKALGETPAWHARGTASGRGWQGQGKSSQQPTVRVLCSSLTEEEIEAQGGEVTCPESHSQGAEQSQAVWERGGGAV